MRNDEKDARDHVHTVDTVPPPAGEDDVYDAKTQIGGLTAEQLAILRQVRDEKPPAGLGFEEILVPVFEDDARSPVDADLRVAKRVPAAGRPAAAKATTPAPATPVPPLATPRVPAVTTVGPGSKRGAVSIDPRARDSEPAIAKAAPSESVETRSLPNDEAPPVAPVFAVRKTDRELAPLFDADEPDAEQDPVPPSYVALFAPLPADAPSGATEAVPPPSRGRGRWLLLVAMVTAVAVVAWLLLPRFLAR